MKFWSAGRARGGSVAMEIDSHPQSTSSNVKPCDRIVRVRLFRRCTGSYGYLNRIFGFLGLLIDRC